jgi:hypothetical protein
MRHKVSFYRFTGIFLLAYFVLSATPLAAQSFTATTNAKEVIKGGRFDLIFKFENIQGGEFTAPDFRKDFLQVGNPSRSVSSTMMNGSFTRTEQLIYHLRPRRVGTFTIEPATLKINGQTLRTEPVTIKVVEGRSGDGNEPQIFIRAVPSTQKAYVGQQVMLDYILYTTANIKPAGVIEESRYEGFWVEEIIRFDKQTIKEVIDGVQYYTKTIRRVALFPKKTGTLTISPFSFQVGIPEEGGSSRPGIVFGKRYDYLAVSTDPFEIEVVPMPEGAPDSFTGAIGEYQQLISLSPQTLTTDDAITMKVSIVGDGDVKRVKEPAYSFPESFDVYDPKLIEENTYEAGSKILNKKVYEYLIVPNEAGTFELQPSFSYFNPDSLKYIVLEDKTYTINVRPGSNKGNRTLPDGLAEGDDQTLDFIKLDTRLHSPRVPFHQSAVFWIFLILPFLFLGSLIVIRQRQAAQSGIDPGLLKSKNAQREAARRLATAEKYLKENESRSFYDEISKAFGGYVCDRLHIPRSSLTKEGLRQRLDELKLSESLIEDVMEIIKTSEAALFSGQGHPEAMQRIYDKSLIALSEMEKAVKK